MSAVAVEGAELSEGLDGAPKLKGLPAGLDPNNPAGCAGAVDGASVAGGFPKLKAGLWLDSCAGLGANKPAPPVLAPNAVVDGGGPAGVVEGLPNLNKPPPEVVAGVVEPNNDGAEVVGVEDLSGVPKPEKRDLGVSPLLLSSGLLWPNLKPPVLAVLVFPKMLGEAGLFSVDEGCDGAPKLNPVVLPAAGAAAPVFPNKPPPVPNGLLVPNND